MLGITLLLYNCTQQETETRQRLFENIASAHTGIAFVNSIENTKDFNIFTYRNFYNGGGVAIGDVNNDGLPDIYFTANMSGNKLYLNKGDFRFEDISARAGVELADKWSTGVVMLDINNDGQMDIYVCNAGYIKGQDQKNVLFINNGDNTFTDHAAAYGLDDNGYGTHAAFFDYDKDGDLDVYLLNNSFIPVNTLNYSNKRELAAEDWDVEDFLKGGGDKLMQNIDGKFVDVSDQAGIYRSLIGFGLGVTVGDVNDDGYEDLYVSNDFFEKDYLYINQKDGTFSEEIESYFNHISHSSMGADMRDINNDGLTDLFVTDMLPDDDYRLKTTASFDDINLRRLKERKGFYHQYMHNTLQLNAGGRFKEIAFGSGVARTDWSWGALMFDADNDSYVDLFVCNGIYQDVIDLDFMDFFANELMQKMVMTGKKEDMKNVLDRMPSVPIPNKAYQNIGGYAFRDVTDQWGFGAETFSNGAAYGDLDGDGDYDLVISNVNQEALVYKNTTSNKSVAIRLEGSGGNRGAFGAKIYLHTDKGKQFYHHNPSRGFQSSVDHTILLGIAEGTSVSALEIAWPDGRWQFIRDLPEDLILSISAPKDGDTIVPGIPDPGLFTELPHPFEANSEDDHIDFYYERGIYRMLSREGPAAAVGDVNGDGLDDLFIGGAAGSRAAVYVQTGRGFERKKQADLERAVLFEDTDAAFFDADGDGDLDLVVGSGGNHVPYNDPILFDRLYLNDGTGNFNYSRDFTPVSGMNTAVVLPFDYDDDGDADLFVGARSVPQMFGFRPNHQLFENDGSGSFIDRSQLLLEGIQLGMITDAVVADIDGGGSGVLVVVGEFMAPRLLRFENGKFGELASNLEDYPGWYYAVQHADLDGDGDQDLILGNHGNNGYLSASKEQPLNLWIHDFDENGTVDRILTQHRNGKDMPVFQKKDLIDQVNLIKKQSIKHADYATMSLQELLPGKVGKNAPKLTARFMESAIAFSEGNGEFKIVPLPIESQWSCIKSLLPLDVDRDGDVDVLTGGNEFGFLPQLSRQDASFGGYLQNDGEGNLITVPERVSGLWADGAIRQILPIVVGGKQCFLFVSNGEKPQLYQFQ